MSSGAVKSLLNAGNKLPYAESMTSSRDSMIIVVFTGAARAKTGKIGSNRYAREGPTTIYGQNSRKGGKSSKSRKNGEQRGGVRISRETCRA
jgi:hypothetical protein